MPASSPTRRPIAPSSGATRKRWRPTGSARRSRRICARGSAPTAKYLQTMWAYLKESGWEKLAYVFITDDPNDQKTYDEIRKLAKLVHDAAPGLKVLCTEQPAPQDPSWGTLVGSVDIWVPLWPMFDEKSVAERQKAGE